MSDVEACRSTWRFTDLFDLAEIQHLQDTFAATHQVASIITDPAGRPLTRPSNFTRLCQDVIRACPAGLQNCMRSDALIGRPNPLGPVVQPCLSGGLWDGGASICVDDVHLANWLVGQVRNEEQDEASMLAYARQIGADQAVFQAALDEVPVMSRERFEQICQFLFEMADLILADGPVHCHGDGSDLLSALLNLGINAGQAMPAGGRLTLTLKIVPGDGRTCDRAQIEVADTGLGMDEATQRRIFEPYFTTRGIEAGTGLGLARVQTCIQEHAGSIEVQSEPGQGTVFTILLPLDQSVDQALDLTG